ncbi:MAG TPA: hypothetical protein RMH99_08900 [Sandaracinaceae bacterium LLY-WYZ-13_1]|nr:hypothetical protein [Sandaracinaceae bacterium LLY-WYZ-13_1]
MIRSRSVRVLSLVAISALACAPVAILGTSRLATGQDRESGAREETVIIEDPDEEEALDADVEGDVRTEGGQKVKVFRFSGLDLAGRLKSPQLLYFLNRMRAEFDRPRLPHRSFIPELQRSAQGKAFR